MHFMGRRFSPWRLLLRLAILAIFAACLAISISSSSGRLSVFCSYNIYPYWNLAVFLFSNFFTHAASVPAVSGAGDAINWALRILAVFVPYSGLTYSLRLLASYCISHGNEVKEAIASRALLAVCRTRDWEPHFAEEEVYVQLPENYDRISKEEQRSCAIVPIPDPLSDPGAHMELYALGYNIHGLVCLPRGYALTRIDAIWMKNVLRNEIDFSKSHAISKSQSWLPILISLFQLLSGIITLVRSIEHETDEYGYAAYSFSIVPYVVMSLVNMIAIGYCGEYPYLYILNTSISREAMRRPETIIDGTLCGNFSHGSSDTTPTIAGGLHSTKPYQPTHEAPDTMPIIAVEPCSSVPDQSTSQAQVSHNSDVECRIPSMCLTTEKRLCSRTKRICQAIISELAPPAVWRTYKHGDPSQMKSAKLSIIRNYNGIQKALQIDIENSIQHFRLLSPDESPDENTVVLGIGALANDLRTSSDVSDKEVGVYNTPILFGYSGYILCAVPYIFMGVMSKFKSRHSTMSQRGWTIAWLVLGQFYMLGSIISMIEYGLGRLTRDPAQNKVHPVSDPVPEPPSTLVPTPEHDPSSKSMPLAASKDALISTVTGRILEQETRETDGARQEPLVAIIIFAVLASVGGYVVVSKMYMHGNSVESLLCF